MAVLRRDVYKRQGEELLRELRQQRSVDIVVLSSQLEDMDGYEFLKRLNLSLIHI